jgi:hypothetical protein
MNSVNEDTVPTFISISEKSVEDEFSDEYLSLYGNLPVILYMDSPDKDILLNRIITSFIENEISKWNEIESEMWIEYETLYVSKEKCSFNFTFSIDLGGAHPNPYAKSLNIDISNISKIENRDLFDGDIDYLETISKFCKLYVTKHLKENSIASNNNWINDGTLPIEENYQSVSIIPIGLLVVFSPYQIASYADGFQSIVIPYTDIQDVLLFKPNPMAYP